MSIPPRQRIRAGLIDLGLIAIWAVIVGAVGIWLQIAAAGRGLGLLSANLLALVIVVVPITLALTLMEAGHFEATPGKLKAGLRVRTGPGNDRVGWGRSLFRNLLKLGLPWSLIHLAVLGLITSPGPSAYLAAVVAVGVPAAYLVSLFASDGRTLYDHVAGTQVISIAPGRRFAEDG